MSAHPLDDLDLDGFHDSTDNCVDTVNADQRDSDGDGFAADTDGGSCGGDCGDSTADAFPGQTSYFTNSFTDESGSPSFDYDCDGIETQQSIRNGGTCRTQDPPPSCPTCERLCGGSGWIGGVPACGEQGDYKICSSLPQGGCDGTSDTNTRTQSCR